MTARKIDPAAINFIEPRRCAISYLVTSMQGRPLQSFDDLPAARRFRTDRASRGVKVKLLEIETVSKELP